jgi:hypothetical protein
LKIRFEFARNHSTTIAAKRQIAAMRFRFTIRDLLWLTAVVALAVGWWLDHRRLTSEPFPSNLSLIIEGGLQVHEIPQSETTPGQNL